MREGSRYGMKDIIIIGAGDFGREVSWAIERINQQKPTWNLLGFVDDNCEKAGNELDGYPVLGTTEYLKGIDKEVYLVCSIGTGRVRKLVMERVLTQKNLHLATLVDPAAIVGRNVQIGEGSVICAGAILTISVQTGKCTIINLNCTVGHETVVESYCTLHPGCNISGKVKLGACTDVGTGSKVIQGLSVASGTTLGAGAVVVRDIVESGTYVGVPVKKVK